MGRWSFCKRWPLLCSEEGPPSSSPPETLTWRGQALALLRGGTAVVLPPRDPHLEGSGRRGSWRSKVTCLVGDDQQLSQNPTSL